MYFAPAAFAVATHSFASNLIGLNDDASHSYVGTFMPRFSITHSPCPSCEYTPQWMNIPRCASRNHSRAARRAGGAGDCADPVEYAAKRIAAQSESLRLRGSGRGGTGVDEPLGN